MKKSSLCLLLLGAIPAPAATVLIDNTTSASIASGDRANIRGFAFLPTAGGTGPAAALTQTVLLESMSLHRPGFGDTVTPNFGAAAGQITDTNAKVYLKVYSSFTGGITAADLGTYLGSSTNGFSWTDVDSINGAGPSAATAAPFDSYTYSFPSLSLDKDTAYWFVFSETSDNTVDVANFRLIVEPGAGAAGLGYMADTIQVRDTAATARDWGVYFNASVTPIPEPSATLLALTAGLLLTGRRRGR